MSAEHPGEMTPAAFVAKWGRVTLSERAASQEHFCDLCRLLGQPTPAQQDATGAEFTFDKFVSVTGGASRAAKGEGGFADVWWRGRFAWEYKRKDKHRDLADAYRQLCQYREALENPPLLVVCDITRTEIHTNFTGTAKRVHVVLLSDLDKPESLDLLRRVFTNPESFKPTVTPEKVTEEVAENIGSLAVKLQARGHDPHQTAHFLMKCMFCLFAEDVGLLPVKLFSRLLNNSQDRPAELTARLTDLFDKMRTGGAFGPESIAWFNGGLFDPSGALELEYDEIGLLRIAAGQDWGSVEPAIFGTLFERSLDPTKRAQIGAHYTSRDDIMLIVEPVVMAPLRREWQAIQEQCQPLVEERAAAARRRDKKVHEKGERTPQWYTGQIEKGLGDFLKRLAGIRILDPACGSGNFLYVAIQQLLNLEKDVIRFAAQCGLGLFPTVRPTQLYGIEINPYAAELAQVVIWIGYLQWMRDNGFNAPRDPILEPLQTIENRDAILDLSDPQHPAPAQWPQADFIIGNPPFLGSKLFRKSGLSDDYVQAMYDAFDLPKSSDLCCYWFELARREIEKHARIRGGLLATQGIRGGDNRTVLQQIKKTGDIFMAWSDREWILDGAAVHVSMVGFDNATQKERVLDGQPVSMLSADLRADEVGAASVLPQNAGIAYMGDTKGGPFDVDWSDARKLLATPNPDGRGNADVVRPWVNGSDITQRTRAMWIIDFACEMSLQEAARYAAAFEVVERLVKPERVLNRRKPYAERWWVHVEPRPAMRVAVEPLPRFIVTTRVAKHRVFGWFSKPTLPDSATFCFARSDDYFFGVLHSSIHEIWARRMGTQLEDRPRYTPTTCFETFALPWPPGREPLDCRMSIADSCCAAKRRFAERHCRFEASKSAGAIDNRQSQLVNLQSAIAQAAAELNEMRERWLNPAEWIDPIAAAIDAGDDFADVPPEARGLIRQSAIMAAAARDANLKKRTLTNLYNERPTWLKLAHRKLDEAVLAAYAAVDPEGGWSPAWAAVWEDSGAGQPLPAAHPLAARRAEVDPMVLGNLLRLNQARGP